MSDKELDYVAIRIARAVSDSPKNCITVTQILIFNEIEKIKAEQNKNLDRLTTLLVT